MTVPADLRLSAQGAFLGRIRSEMRLIKITRRGSEIAVVVVLDREPSERIREDVSEATTEIISDFPDVSRIVEAFQVDSPPLPTEDILQHGWIYKRAEPEIPK